VHEAGHAVAAQVHGIEIASVTLRPGRVTFAAPITSDPWAALMIFLASAAAELHAFGVVDEIGCASDTRCARGYAYTLGGDADEAAILADATDRCRFLIDAHWLNVEALALQLLASPHGSLSGADLTPTRELALTTSTH
jgi:Zn-dependent protease